MSADLTWMPALEQADLIRSGQVSSTELVTHYLDRIEAINPRLNAFLTVCREKALARAAQPLTGPFAGIPIGIKDLNNTAGIRTTMGTASLTDYVPTFNDASVDKLLAAGFVIVGKTNTPEFGSAIVTEPVAYGACYNPWDVARTPGGSSGGSASALAAGLVSIVHGSDGGGSIRIPSAWCGLVGIKPSRGRVSAAPAPQDLLSGQGPIAHTVRDAAALLDVMAGYVAGDQFYPPPPPKPFLSFAGEPPPPLRVAFTASHPDAPVHPAWAAAARDAALLVERLGHKVTEDAPPWSPASADHPVIRARCALMVATIDDLPPVETLDPFSVSFLRQGEKIPIREALTGDTKAALMARQIVGWFDAYDVLITPTVAQPAPLIGAMRDEDDQWQGLIRSVVTCPFTADWNMTGQPAINLPLYVDDDGRPIGVQFVGRPGDEATLIQLAAQIEEALPWAGRHPAL